MQLDETAAPRQRERGALRQRVLVAEDDADFRALVGAALSLDDYDIVEVDDGRDLRAIIEAVGAGSAGAFDVIVADVHLPGGTAIDVLASALRGWLTTPVILMTGHCDQHVHLAADWLGVACVLEKPFELHDLRAAVARFARRARPQWTRRRARFD